MLHVTREQFSSDRLDSCCNCEISRIDSSKRGEPTSPEFTRHFRNDRSYGMPCEDLQQVQRCFLFSGAHSCEHFEPRDFAGMEFAALARRNKHVPRVGAATQHINQYRCINHDSHPWYHSTFAIDVRRCPERSPSTYCSPVISRSFQAPALAVMTATSSFSELVCPKECRIASRINAEIDCPVTSACASRSARS